MKYAVYALRPKQWIKNLLVFLAPFAAGVGIDSNLNLAVFGFCAFSLAASIGYIINDLHDIEIDRQHPKKRTRPFASGVLSYKTGITITMSLILVLGLLLTKLPVEFNIVLLIYLANTFLYTKFLKHQPVTEMFVLAFGFILRLISGALVMDLMISEWFLIVGGFGALFIVSAKRLAEWKQRDSQAVRKVIYSYSADFLYSCTSISMAVSVTGYCFWAFSHTANAFWYEISVVPFVMALFRYRWISEQPVVEAPEDAFLGDKVMIILAVISIMTLTMAIY